MLTKEKTVLSTNGPGQTEELHVLACNKIQLKMDQKPQYKTWYLKSGRVETKEDM